MNIPEISARLDEIEKYAVRHTPVPSVLISVDTRDWLISTLREALKAQVEHVKENHTMALVGMTYGKKTAFKLEEAESIIRLALGSITPYEGTNGLPVLEAAIKYNEKYKVVKDE